MANHTRIRPQGYVSPENLVTKPRQSSGNRCRSPARCRPWTTNCKAVVHLPITVCAAPTAVGKSPETVFSTNRKECNPPTPPRQCPRGVSAPPTNTPNTKQSVGAQNGIEAVPCPGGLTGLQTWGWCYIPQGTIKQNRCTASVWEWAGSVCDTFAIQLHPCTPRH